MKSLLLRLILFVSLSLMLSAASAQAQTTVYWGGGTSNIANGTALSTTNATLSGTWDNSLQNWSSAYSPTVYVPWGSDYIANLGYYTGTGNAALAVSGNKTLNGMVASTTAATGTPRFSLTGSGSPTVTLVGDVARFLISGTANSNGVDFSGINLGASTTTLLKDGAGRLQISGGSSDAFTGKVLIRSGLFTKDNNTSLAGVTDFEVSGYRATITGGSANGGAAFTAPSLRL